MKLKTIAYYYLNIITAELCDFVTSNLYVSDFIFKIKTVIEFYGNTLHLYLL